MIALMAEMNRRALELGVPLGIRLDVTCRYNERCVHCYLDHAERGEHRRDPRPARPVG